MKTKKTAKSKEAWTKQERVVFKELGIGDGELGLRKLIRGQRRINGRLYEAIDLILAHLGEGAFKAYPKQLVKAKRINDAVLSNDPPGCSFNGVGGGH